jgi:O-methyltransferase domain
MSDSNPFQALLQIAGGYCLPRCLHVVADLGVADMLDEAPRTAAELATAVGADADALGRILSLLAAHGVFAFQGDAFCHSPMSWLLRTDHPHSLRAFTRMFGLPSWWAIYGALDHAVRTGLPATKQVLSSGLFAYFAAHPDESAVFNAAMVAKAHGQVAGILTTYDFSGFRMVGDIGGGRGHLLRAVLEAVPTARGVLFDLPHVVQEAAGIGSERLTLQGGDFFKDTLPVCDAYLVMEVIHAWGDKEATAILQAIRRVAPANAKVLLIEQMVPDDPGPHWSKMLDIHMLTLVGGRQRTRQEYEVLFDSAGFSYQREVDTGTDISILEAVPA